MFDADGMLAVDWLLTVKQLDFNQVSVWVPRQRWTLKTKRVCVRGLLVAGGAHLKQTFALI